MFIIALEQRDVKGERRKNSMTNKDLSQYYWLKKEIEADERRLARMKDGVLGPRAQRLDGMPRGGGGDSMGDAVAEIADMEAIIAAKKIQSIHECQRIERYIQGIPDAMTRMVFELRCIDCMSWSEVAANMGYRMSEENARQIYHRYIKSEPQKPSETEKTERFLANRRE